MGRLDVRIIEARNLPNNTEILGSGKPDPYVKVELDNNTHNTFVASSTTTPKWDEVFKFVVADPDSAQVSLKVYSKNLVSVDAFIGSYKISLAGLFKGQVKDSWIILQQCKTNAEIHICLLAHDFGIEFPSLHHYPVPKEDGTSASNNAQPNTCAAAVVVQQQQGSGVIAMDTKSRLTRFFQKYDRAKIASIDDLMAQFLGRESDLWVELSAQYGPETTGETAPEDRLATLHARLTRFFQKYNPENPSGNATTVRNLTYDRLAPLSIRNEQELWAQLIAKYGPEPDDDPNDADWL